MGRFINADALVSTGQGVLGNNMFAYCLNNPAVRVDIAGRSGQYIDLTDQDKDEDGIPDEPGYSPHSGDGSQVNEQTAPTYPQNPYDFNPKGLERREHVKPGQGSNGGVFKWYYPGDKRPIFEWDEDWKIGSHYHAMEVEWGGSHSGDHLWPGAAIEEPWRSRFF